MFLSGGAGVERAEISALAGLRIFLSGIKAILAGLQLSNHNDNLLHCHRLCHSYSLGNLRGPFLA